MIKGLLIMAIAPKKYAIPWHHCVMSYKKRAVLWRGNSHLIDASGGRTPNFKVNR